VSSRVNFRVSFLINTLSLRRSFVVSAIDGGVLLGSMVPSLGALVKPLSIIRKSGLDSSLDFLPGLSRNPLPAV
jgi:hypothetical protein